MMDYVLAILAVVLIALTVWLAPAWADHSLVDTEPPPGSLNPYRHFSFLPVALVLTAVIGVVLAVFLYSLARSAILLDYLKLILLNRYGLLIAAFLIGLIWLALGVAPELLRILFFLNKPWQLVNLTWRSLLLAVMVMATARVSEENAVARFGIQIPFTGPWKPAHEKPWDPGVSGLLRVLETVTGDHAGWGTFRWVLLLLLGLPLPYACVRCSLAAGTPSDAGYLW